MSVVFEKGVLQPKTFGFEWTIERFFADCEKIGVVYTSPVFPLHYSDKVTKWHIQVYPKGQNEKSKDYVSLNLCFRSENVSELIVDYKVSIASKQNSFCKKVKAWTFKGPEIHWGWAQFVKQDVVRDKKDSALINDTLTISCEITFPHKTQELTEPFKDYDTLLDKIGKGFEDYEKLIENNYFSDVTFNIKDTKMYLHKAILMCRNSVFKAMFEHDMKENKESLVNITDVDYEVMRELFRFIYSGKVENIQELAQDLLIAADKYSVTELKAMCEKVLYQNLTVDNAIDYLKLTDMCDTIHLKRLVINFVADHYKDIVRKSEFKDLHSSIMCEIFRTLAEKK